MRAVRAFKAVMAGVALVGIQVVCGCAGSREIGYADRPMPPPRYASSSEEEAWEKSSQDYVRDNAFDLGLDTLEALGSHDRH